MRGGSINVLWAVFCVMSILMITLLVSWLNSYELNCDDNIYINSLEYY